MTTGETKALAAIRDLRRRCLIEGWGPIALTMALSLALEIDRIVARRSGRGAEWERAEERGRELANRIAAKEEGWI